MEEGVQRFEGRCIQNIVMAANSNVTFYNTETAPLPSTLPTARQPFLCRNGDGSEQTFNQRNTGLAHGGVAMYQPPGVKGTNAS